MVELTDGERQRREVNTYNLFYSAISARADPSLAAHGVRIPVMFPVIENRADDIQAEPDFVLYDGSTCVLAEIKSGNNISDRHIEQMRQCARVDIETAEDALKDAQVLEKTSYGGTVTAVEPIIVYQDLDEDYVDQISEDSKSFRDALDALTEHAVVMAQDYGGELRILDGAFKDDGNLQSLLESGVELPENPPDEIPLTEGMEHEILAMAICDVWGEQAVDHEDGVVVSRTEVRDYFAPRHNIGLANLDLVFKFLDEFGACDRIGNHRYEFTIDHIDAILQVESQVMSESVEDYLHGADQTSLDDHIDEDTDDDDINGRG